MSPTCAGWEACARMALAVPPAFGFLLIIGIDTGRSFSAHALPVLRGQHRETCMYMV